MRIGVHWTPCAAGVVAVALLGAGVGNWLVAPLAAAAAALAVRFGVRRWRRRRARERDRLTAVQQALRRREQHVAETVHELRTPLCTIVAALELLRGDWFDDPTDAATALDEAALAAHHLGQLVDDVLDDAALSAGRLQLSIGAHRVQDLLGECRRLLRLHAARRGARIAIDAVDDVLLVRADPRRFVQVVANLVGNALKFAPAGSDVQVRVEADARRVRVVVADRGPGVGQDVRHRLFAPFAAGAAAPGTGLGLFVSMRLVRQMGGRIGLATPVHGAEFWFELPRAVPPDRRQTDVAPAPAAAR
jgi:signal transduction histidine kinase